MDTSEKRFEYDIEQHLISNGYEQFNGQDADGNWVHTRQHDVSKCIYMDVLCKFIAKTQPKEWTRYTKYYGVQAVDNGQMEAARSVGFSHSQAMRLVVLPQAIKNILPALGNEFVTVIKESSIVSVIGLADLMFRTNDVIAVTYKSLPCLAIAALCYFAMTFTGGRIIALAERKMNHGK